MRVLRLLLAAAGSGALLACGGGGGSSPSAPAPGPSPTPGPKPNIILVLVDDQDIYAMSNMPRLKSLIADRGVTFTNFITTTPVCGPSRASFLTGLYAHNHGTEDNRPPLGGFEKFYGDRRESNTIAVWLKAAGYRTIFLGKYINGYPAGPGDYVPPGWDDWHGAFGASDVESGLYYDYFLNDNGKVTRYGSAPEDYQTDVLAQKTVEAIRTAAADKSKPFFIYLAPSPPHVPAIYAPRHDGVIKDAIAPRLPSYDEADIRDKPRWLQAYDPLRPGDEARNDQIWAARLACMLAVDEMIDKMVQELSAQGVLSNTFIVYTSDNGLLMGQHRLVRAKGVPYEESIRVPFVVAGPGVAAGQTRSEILANIDIAPTFVEWGRASAPELDGRSFASLLTGGGASSWRQDILLEYFTPAPADQDYLGVVNSWVGLRTTSQTYVEYADSVQDKEYYDLRTDPYQLTNTYYDSPPPSAIPPLAARLTTLKSCRGASCRN